MKLLFIFEVLLTIMVWISGWKWKALLPIAIAYVGMFLGIYIMAGSRDFLENIIVVVGNLKVGVIIALVMMYVIRVVQRRRQFRRESEILK